jgi:poly(3-hydroxybutyrate) depolymerase
MLSRRTLLLAIAALPACGPTAIPREAPGMHELTDQIRGKKRRSLLFVPEGLTDKGPMLVGLHDSGEQPETELARWKAICAAEGWVGLFPDYQKDDFKDDTTNLSHVLQRATAMGGVDRRRVYLTGHGTGGRRAYALASTHSGLLTAVATSGAVLAFEGQAEALETPGASILHVHGANDDVVPLAGGPLPGDTKTRTLVPVTEALRPWIQIIGADDTPVVDGPRTTWSSPTRHVVLFIDPEGGHARTDAQTEAMRAFFLQAPPQI